MKFLKPVDGDVLFTTADGYEKDGSLYTTVTLTSTPGCAVAVNGVYAAEEDGIYTVTVRLDGYRNALEARNEETGEKTTIYVYWFKNGYKTYRMAVDDVIRCFENIYLHQEEYTSIFQDPYLAIFRDLHDAYGVPVHMHVFYETNDGHFNLSMFPDKYKAEFQANGHWLKFTFHSRPKGIPLPTKTDETYHRHRNDNREVHPS